MARISIPEAFSWAFKLYLNNFPLFLFLSAISLAPGILFQAVSLFLPADAVGIRALLWLTSFTALLILGATTICAVHNTQAKARRSLPELIGDAFERSWSLLGAALVFLLMNALFGAISAVIMILGGGGANLVAALMGLALGLGMLWAIAYFGTVLIFSPFFIVIDAASPWSGIRKSMALTKGSFRLVLCANLLWLLVIAAISLPFLIGLKMLGAHPFASSIASDAIAICFIPLLIAFYYFLFVLLKTRQAETAISIYKAGHASSR